LAKAKAYYQCPAIECGTTWLKQESKVAMRKRNLGLVGCSPPPAAKGKTCLLSCSVCLSLVRWDFLGHHREVLKVARLLCWPRLGGWVGGWALALQPTNPASHQLVLVLTFALAQKQERTQQKFISFLELLLLFMLSKCYKNTRVQTEGKR
jgi:hypothetical protein